MIRTFLSALEIHDPARVAIFTVTGGVTIGDLLAAARVHASRSVLPAELFIVPSDDIECFVGTLLALDGMANAFLLQPRGVGLNPEWIDVVRREFAGLEKSGGTTRWILPTSGTTGTPKLIAHDFQSLTATTKTDLSVGARHRWGLLYDPARFAGLQVVLQALMSGAALVAPPLDDLEQAVEFMVAHQVTALSATPSYWRKLLMTKALARLPLCQITLGGEIADHVILNALRRRFPRGRIVHIYASTEVGVGFSVADGQPGFPLTYLDDDSIGGIQLKIRDDGHLLIRKARSGTHVVAGEYADADADGFVDTEDLVEVRNDRVVFLGRAGGSINVGGNKVNPEEIEALLYNHPQVAAVRVYGKSSSMLGNLVAADVQLFDHSQHDGVKKELSALCRDRLPRWQWPASIEIVERLEVGPGGKILRSRNVD